MTHPRNEFCSNLIKAKEGQRLQIRIQTLDPNCLGKETSDWIIIRGSSERIPSIRKKLCKEVALKPFTSVSNELLIRFESQTYDVKIRYNMTIEIGIICRLN